MRKINGVTQAELSRYLGYGYTAVSNYENAEHQPDYNTLMKIAEYFNVSIDFLMGADDCMEQMRCIPEEMDMLQEYRKLKLLGKIRRYKVLAAKDVYKREKRGNTPHILA